jgi:hydrogenase/urease accessory protein HupE
MRLLLCLAWLLSPVAAHAHGVSPAISGFYAGGLTVLAGPEDLLQWVALCAFAALHPPARAGWTAEALTAGLLAGFCAGAAGAVSSVPAWVGEAGLLAVGALLVAGVRAPFAALLGLAFGIGALRGLHDGLDAEARPDKLALAAGIGITAYLLMTVGVSTLVWLQPRIAPARVVAFRAFGSWVVAVALMLGAFDLAGR